MQHSNKRTAKRGFYMRQAEIVYLSEENIADFFALATEYLPGSDEEKIRRRAGRYPRAFVALVTEGELAGVAFGWPRELDAPEDKSFRWTGSP